MNDKRILVIVLSFLLALSACATRKIAPASVHPGEVRGFDRYLNEGIRLMGRGDYEGAIREFGQAQSLNPKSARAHNLCGIAYFREQNYASAEAQFLRATDLDASNVDALNNLGSVYFAERQFLNAERMYRKAMDLSPTSVSPYYSLGTLLLIQGRAEEGTRYLEKGIRLDPQFLDTHGALAIDVPTPGAEWSETYFVYAKLYARSGQPKQAFDYLRKAQKAGFHDWKRLMDDKDFENLRRDPQIKEFIRQDQTPGTEGSRR
jgi:Flp pilus assembly protein TadD